MGEEDVFDLQHPFEFLIGGILVEKLADLKAGLGKFVSVKRRDPRFGGTEGFSSQPFLLILVEQHVIRHDHLCAFRHHQARPDPFLMQGLGLLEKLSDVQRHAVSDDIDGVVVKHAARKLVQGEFPILIDDGVAGVAAALKADDYIRLGGEDVGDFSLPLITPVRAHDGSDHAAFLLRCRNVPPA